jgi:microcin C transport system substrate-binding protein
MIYRDILSAIKMNDFEVKFTFKDGQNRELPLLISSLPIFSKAYFSNKEFEKTTLEFPLGNGPYKVVKADSGKSITFKRVKNYWAKDLAVNVGRHNFDEITYEYYRDSNVLVEAFKAGAYDFRQENISRNWANSYNIPRVENGEIVKKEISHNLPAPMQCFVFNLRKDKFQNLNLRKAISLAFDFEWVRKKIFYGAYTRTNSFFDNSSFASKALPSEDELEILNKFTDQIPEEVFTQEFKLPITDASGFPRKNLFKAQELLNNAGYLIKEGKLIDPKTNLPVEIEFLVRSKAFYMVIAPMIKNLATLGIDARTRLSQENQYLNRLKNYDFDIIVNVFSSGMMPADEQFSYWHSSQKNIIGGRNLVGVDNEAVDYLVEKISGVKNKEELQILTKALDRVLLNGFYVIPQWYSQKHRILYKNKFNMPNNPPPYSLALDSWWEK